MSMYNLYQELIIDHGTSPRNFYQLENPDAHAESYNPLCGDRVIVFLAIKDNKIVNATFQGQGCAISTASASIMTEILIGKSIKQASKLFFDFTKNITENSDSNEVQPIKKPNTTIILPDKLLALTGVKNYPSRVKCATLAWHTLQAALRDIIK